MVTMGTILHSPPVRLCSTHAMPADEPTESDFLCQQPTPLQLSFGIVRGTLPYRPKWVSDGIFKDGNPDQLAKAMLEQQYGNVFASILGFDDEEQSKGWFVVMVSRECLSPGGISTTAGIVVIRFDFGQQSLELFSSAIILDEESNFLITRVHETDKAIGSDGYAPVMAKCVEGKQACPCGQLLKLIFGVILKCMNEGCTDIHKFQFMQQSSVFDVGTVTHGLPGSNWVLPQKSCFTQGEVSLFGQIEGNTGIWFPAGTLGDISGVFKLANSLPCRTLIAIKVKVTKLWPGHEAHFKETLKDIQVTWLKDKLAWGKRHMGNIVSCSDEGLCLYRWGYKKRR